MESYVHVWILEGTTRDVHACPDTQYNQTPDENVK